jgi:heat shock protein HslJ
MFKQSLLIVTILSLITLSVFAKKKCKPKPNELSGSYSLVQYKSTSTMTSISGEKTSITIDTKNKSFSANVGCNSISGRFNTNKNNIEPMQLMQTEMYCAENKIEEPFVFNLSKVIAYKWKSDQLQLCDKDTVLIVLKKKK